MKTDQKHVIFETNEEAEAEDDIAQLVPKKNGSSSHMSYTQKLNLQKINREIR